MPRRIRSIEANGSVYTTSNVGILKLEAPTLFYQPAGLPRGLDILLSLTASATGIMATNDNSAYRMLWGITDSHNYLILGMPSSRQTISNPLAGNQNVLVTFPIPAFITTSHFYQIYRTKEVNGVGLDPGDDMFLAYEGNPTAAEITAGSITITDIRSKFILGDPLYTNPTQETISKGKLQPPLARDLTLYRDRVLYGNTTLKHRLSLSLIGMNGFAAGISTITIGGVTYNCASYGGAYSTAPAGENIATGTFVFYTSGLISERIRGTAESLIRVINRYSSNVQYYAFYVSNPTDTPGQILLEERGIGGTAFSVTAHSSINLNFEPKLPTSGTSVSSSSDRRKNRVYFSEPNQPEAVPQYNYLDVGPENEAVQRVLGLKEVAVILKENSVWIWTGTSESNYSVTQLDATVSVSDRYDSAAILNNQVFLLTEQGVTSVNPSGAQIVSRPEEFALRFPTIDGDGFSVGVGHESLRTYLLSTFDVEFKQEGYTYPYSVFALNNGHESLPITRWLLNVSCMTVFKNRLYYGLNNIKGHVLKQRINPFESFDETAKADVSLINIANKTAVISFTPGVDYDTYPSQWRAGYVNGFGKGWIIVDAGKRFLVTDWNPATNTATFHKISGLTNGNKDCYRPILWTLEPTPIVIDRPDTEKHFDEVKLIGKFEDTYQFIVEYANEDDKKKYDFYYKYEGVLPQDIVFTNDLKDDWVHTSIKKATHVLSPVPKKKRGGAQLSTRITNNVAGAQISLKLISVRAMPTGSDKTTQ